MRLGSFWGLPAPAILIVFDEDRDFLYKCLSKLDSDSTAGILVDVGKEFSFLKRMVSQCSWSVPEYDRVSEQYSPMKKVVNGRLEGADDFFSMQFRSELVFRCLEEIVKREQRGDYRECSALESGVDNLLANESFQLGKLDKIAKGLVKELSCVEQSCIEGVAEKFRLVRKAPDVLWFGGQKVRLQEDEQRVWQWFKDRIDFIDEILKRCHHGRSREETTFGVPFFDMTKRKPSSLQYKVIDIFDCAKDYKTSHLLVKCIEECSVELAKFKQCLKKYVLSNDDNSVVMDQDTFINVLAAQSNECIDFFGNMLREGIMKYDDYQVEDVEMLCKIFELVVARSDWDKVIGVQDADKVARRIGVCGLSEHSLPLFSEAVSGISLMHQGKIKKSPEYVQEIQSVVSDVDALLQTLLPVGQEI